MLKLLAYLPIDRITEEVPGVEMTAVPMDEDLPDDLQGEVLLTLPFGSPNMAEVLANGVKWVHTIGTGVDGFPLELVGDRILTCSRGASAIRIAEWVMAMLLSDAKRLPTSWVKEKPNSWNMADLEGLHGKTLGLVGFGSIGQAIARRALPFGMHVQAYRRSAQSGEVPGVTPVSSLPALAAAADHLVIAAPATPATAGLIGNDILAAMKPDAHLINISRGSLIDQNALREALDGGRLRLASLDTVTPEPLPEGHWMYQHDEIRLSPHISWGMPDSFDAIVDTFIANLKRYMANETLEGVVDIAHGY